MNDLDKPQSQNVPESVNPFPAAPVPVTQPESNNSLAPGNMPPRDLFESQGAVPPPPPANQGTPSPIIPPPTSSGRRRFPIKVLVLFVVLVVALVGLFAVISKKVPLGGKTTITWWGLWEDDGVITPIISEYEQANPSVKINYVKQSKEEYRERLTNALAQGNGPDIFRFHNTWVPMFRTNLSPVPSSIMTAQEFAQTYYPVMVSDLTQSTGILGLPLMYDGLGLYVNDDIFATYGKSTPSSWFDVRDTAVALTIKDDKGVIKQAGISLGRTENVDHWQEILALMMLQNGVNLNNPTGQYAEQALSFYDSFSTSLGVWDETLPSSTIAFESGKLAMMIAPSWRAHEIREQNPSLKFHVAPVPQLPKERPDDPDITYATYWAEGVNTQSKVKDEAWKFLKFLSSKETLTKLYTNATQVRAFGELYPRRDMQDLLINDPLTGGIISLAPNAKSWYLASRTFDGQTGINSQLSTYLENAINSTNDRANSSSVTSSLQTAATGVSDVLIKFGLIAPTPAPKK